MTQNVKIAGRIQAMLAKAESCRKLGTDEGDAEAENAWMLAQKLITKHGIDAQMLREQAAQKGEKTEEIKEYDIYVSPGAYRRSRALLLNWMVGAMTGGDQRRVCHYGTYVRFFAYSEDFKAIQEMFEIVEPQMVAAGKRRTARGEHHWEGLHAKTWLVQYFQSYAARVCQRLTDARKEAAEEVVFAEGYQNETGQTVGRVTGALVLRTKKDEMELAYKGKYLAKVTKKGEPSKCQGGGVWKAPKAQSYSDDARRAGREDGEKARIRTDSELASRRALR